MSMTSLVISNRVLEDRPNKSIERQLHGLSKDQSSDSKNKLPPIKEKKGGQSTNLQRLDSENKQPRQRQNRVKKRKQKKTANINISPLALSKLILMRQFANLINLSNNYKIVQEGTFKSYRAFVGKGNNSSLVKSILKNRFWWVVQSGQMVGQYNFVWTQIRQNDILQLMPKQKRQSQSAFQEISFLLDQSQSQDSELQKSKSIFQKRSQSMNPSSTTFSRGKQKNQSIERTTQITKKQIGSFKNNTVIGSLRKILSCKDYKQLKSLGLANAQYNFQHLRRNNCRWEFNSSEKLSHNHLQNNWNLSNKKALFMNLKVYLQAKNQDPFKSIPRTFHIQNIGDKQHIRFTQYYSQINQLDKLDKKKKFQKRKNVWIVKPGENSNRGCGINVTQSIEQINQIIQTDKFDDKGRARSHIVQEYIMPFLYNKRKFDIRTYILLTSVNGCNKGYWYQEGYIRTTSKQFTLKNLANKFIHLTNDAVQKKSEDYSKYQLGNKITYQDFQRYLDSLQEKQNFGNKIVPQMKRLATEAIRSVYNKIDPFRRHQSFQIFGLDFMIDQNFKVWLIEANTNPCLQVSSPILGKIIPNLLQNTFRLVLDSLFPMPAVSDFHLNKKPPMPQNIFEYNKFELVFDQLQEYKELNKISSSPIQIFDIQEQEEDVYDDQDKKEQEIKQQSND